MLLGLVFKPFLALAASYPVLPPDPVGGTLYRTKVSHETLLPILIIAGALLAACIVHLIAVRIHRPHSPN